ncbi:PrsW family intramembrane metalloprotease [Halorientalis salina]|uniref:PrsW family intramembrane metalloprotease n=1 Tax=Halorientalis salina TaxID=2932266 RepID=UPI0010AC5EEB|nr:PrsW family glutamic-type intramembrane protease [Halorientalis salina]
MASDRDPIERSLGESRDLYDIATWENRTVLDGVSVRITRGLSAGKRPLVLALAVVIILAQVAFTGFAVLRNPTLGALTVLSVVPAFALAAYIWYGDPTLRESAASLVVTFLLGVFFAGFAAVVNSLFGGLFAAIPVVGMALFFFLVVGPVEEFVKWLAVRFYAFRLDEFDAVVDGAVYGAVAGLGFAFIENVLYITAVYLDAVQGGASVLPATIGIASVRSLAGPGHVIYSAFAGYYLGLAKFNEEHAAAIVVKGLLVATLIHGLYNTAVTYLPTVIPFSFPVFVGFIVLYDGVWLAILFRKIARYRTAYHDALGEDGAVAE